MNFDLINGLEEYWGLVVDTNDPLKAGRVKVRVETVFDEIQTDMIPWAAPKFVDSDTFEKPYTGEVVQVTFHNGDIMMPKWFRIRKSDKTISDDNYESMTILKDKDLSNYGLDGRINLSYTKEVGLTVALERNDSTSAFTIRNDNTLLLENGDSGKAIHLSDKGISIGSENESQQPAVVGNDAMKAMQKLNDSLQSTIVELCSHLDKLATASSSSPYTKHLEIVFKNYKTSIKAKVDELHEDNDLFFPEIKSTFITLDKN